MAKKIEQKDALAWIIEGMREDVIQPDEFTIQMVYDRIVADRGTTTKHAIRNRLERQVEAGELSKRSVLISSRNMAAYKRSSKQPPKSPPSPKKPR